MTPDESALLARRKTRFDQFYQEMMPVLVDFIQRLGQDQSHTVLHDASRFLGVIDESFKYDLISTEDRSWFMTRIMYFVGEYFVQNFGGHWLVNDTPGSRFFARYVVGGFGTRAIPNGQIDPLEVATSYTDSPAPRDLVGLIASVERELKGVC